MALGVAILLALAAERLFAAGMLTASFLAAALALLVCCYIVLLSAPHVVRWVRAQPWTFPWSYRITPQGEKELASLQKEWKLVNSIWQNLWGPEVAFG